MKSRLFALVTILALSFAGWAQEPAAPASPNSTPKAEGCCHHRSADMKDGESCCHHGTAKDMTCCDAAKCTAAKDGKSCCEANDMKAALKECKKDGCCKDGKCCGNSKSDKAAMECCGNKCEHHKSAAVS